MKNLEMKTVKLTSSQVQNFIHMCDGDDCPILLAEFHFNNVDKVYKSKRNWLITMNYTAIQWLKKELKSYIKFLKEEIEQVKNAGSDIDQYWKDEAKYHKTRIILAERTLSKLT